MDKTKTSPVVTNRKGHFQLSVWKKKRVIPPRHNFDVERVVDTVSVCLQYSRFRKSTNSWNNQNIWFTPDELHDLIDVLSKFNMYEGFKEAAASS